MSAHHSLRSHSLLKMVFGQIGNTYQAYCYIYKTHIMTTHYGGPGQLTEREIPAHKTTDTDLEQTQEFHQVNANDFKESEPNNPARLTLTTRELDGLYQCVQAREAQTMEALHHIECKQQSCQQHFAHQHHWNL